MIVILPSVEKGLLKIYEYHSLGLGPLNVSGAQNLWFLASLRVGLKALNMDGSESWVAC